MQPRSEPESSLPAGVSPRTAESCPGAKPLHGVGAGEGAAATLPQHPDTRFANPPWQRRTLRLLGEKGRKEEARLRAHLRQGLRGSQPPRRGTRGTGSGLRRELCRSPACAMPSAPAAPRTPASSGKGLHSRSLPHTGGEQAYGIKVKQHYISCVKGFYEKSRFRYKLVKGHFTI